MYVKWIQTAFYVYFVVNNYWSELGIVFGSTREWI